MAAQFKSKHKILSHTRDHSVAVLQPLSYLRGLKNLSRLLE